MYYLMNKDTKLAEIAIINNTVYIKRAIVDLPGFIQDINEWVESRSNPVNRENIRTLLKLAQLSTTEEYVKYIRAVSVTDTMWIKSDKDNITWNDINPFKNRLSRIVSEIALNMNYNGGNIKSPSPDYKIDGSIDKCWKRINGKLYLYKTNGEMWAGNNGRIGIRPYMEYYSNQLFEALEINDSHYVKYGITVSKTNKGYLKPYVYCGAFTSEKYGFIPMHDTKYRNIPLQKLYSILTEENKLMLREMLLVDSIILNIDRHSGNYGFFIDNDTLKIKGLAPIFDQDCSLGFSQSIQNEDIERLYQILAFNQFPKTQLGSYVQQARAVITQGLANNMRNIYPFHFTRLPENIDISDERIRFMEYIVNKQIKAILGK